MSANIAIFVPHVGCPHACAFCDQRTITGVQELPRAEDVDRICRQALEEVKDRSDTEVAFFGGSFTAIERGYMLELLNAAEPYIGGSGFKGIRISTRPDCIDREVLDILKSKGVSAIELGAQSMNDEVLKANARGHDSRAVYEASKLIREYGFELGLQIMTGLYKSDSSKERETIEQVIKIHPQTVRIYPVCVLENTELARLYKREEYVLMSFDEVLDICVYAAEKFTNAGIKLLRIGLHASKDVEQKLVAGYYHPSFGELVRSRQVRNIIEKSTQGMTNITVYAGSGMISAVSGHKKCNKEYFAAKGAELTVKPDETLGRHEIRIEKEIYRCI